jgi:hypothetical protein
MISSTPRYFILIVLVGMLILTGCSSYTIIDWVSFIKFNGITYLRVRPAQTKGWSRQASEQSLLKCNFGYPGTCMTRTIDPKMGMRPSLNQAHRYLPSMVTSQHFDWQFRRMAKFCSLRLIPTQRLAPDATSWILPGKCGTSGLTVIGRPARIGGDS